MIPFVFERLFGAAESAETPVLPGPEDIELEVGDDPNPSLLVSCQDRRRSLGDGGFIARVNIGPNGPVSGARLTITGWPEGHRFHPLGISFVAAERRLYVVNRAGRRSNGLEVFDVDADRLKYVKSLVAPEYLLEPNDVAALPGERLFVTNSHEGSGILGNLLADLIRARKGSVVCWDGSQWSGVADKLRFANGVALDVTGRLHVTTTLDGQVRVFSKRAETWSQEESVDVGGLPDNLAWQAEGQLLVAVHKGLAAFVFSAITKGAVRSGARVVRLDLRTSPTTVDVIFEDNGKRIGTISSAVCWGDHLYLGQVLGAGIGFARRKP